MLPGSVPLHLKGLSQVEESTIHEGEEAKISVLKYADWLEQYNSYLMTPGASLKVSEAWPQMQYIEQN